MAAIAIAPTFEVVHKDFGSFLRDARQSQFVLDLSSYSLLEVIRAYIRHKSKTRPDFGKSYSIVLFNVKKVEDLYGISLKPDMITDVFWSYFVEFLQEQGLALSTIELIVGKIRSAVNWGRFYGVKTHPSFDEIKIHKVHNDNIALSPDDVSHIYHFDCRLFYKQRGKERRSDYIETMERVRDQFVLGCNLFQRYSDMRRIEPSNFDGDLFKIVQQKTGSFAVVDMRAYCIDYKATKAILEKYGYSAPYPHDINNFNKYLHQLLKDAGFTELVQISHREKGKIVTENIPRWKLISSHCCRRTAITNAVSRGCNLHQVKKCSGHASLDMLDRYVKD